MKGGFEMSDNTVSRRIYSKDSTLPTPKKPAPMPPVKPPKPSNVTSR